MHKIPKLGLTYRQVALEPILPATMLHSQEMCWMGRLGPRRTAGLGAGKRALCPALLWLGLSESGWAGEMWSSWALGFAMF